jgi:hypothetical protein
MVRAGGAGGNRVEGRLVDDPAKKISDRRKFCRMNLKCKPMLLSATALAKPR